MTYSKCGGLRVRWRIFEGLLVRQHALVEDARDENAIIEAAVKEHMPPFFKTEKARTNPVAWPTEQRVACKQPCRALKLNDVTLGLSYAPGLKSVCADAEQIGFGGA